MNKDLFPQDVKSESILEVDVSWEIYWKQFSSPEMWLAYVECLMYQLETINITMSTNEANKRICYLWSYCIAEKDTIGNVGSYFKLPHTRLVYNLIMNRLNT